MDKKGINRKKRHNRLRRKILGTQRRPRLCVHRGLANIHAQLIDDINEKVLLSAASFNKEERKKIGYGGNAKAAAMVGEILAEKAKKKNITEVVFDRGGFLYHGRIKALADSARKHGLKF